MCFLCGPQTPPTPTSEASVGSHLHPLQWRSQTEVSKPGVIWSYGKTPRNRNSECGTLTVRGSCTDRTVQNFCSSFLSFSIFFFCAQELEQPWNFASIHKFLKRTIFALKTRFWRHVLLTLEWLHCTRTRAIADVLTWPRDDDHGSRFSGQDNVSGHLGVCLTLTSSTRHASALTPKWEKNC